jgi:hypothetical protein
MSAVERWWEPRVLTGPANISMTDRILELDIRAGGERRRVALQRIRRRAGEIGRHRFRPARRPVERRQETPWWLQPSKPADVAPFEVELRSGPPRVSVAVYRDAHEAILAEIRRLARDGVETAGWLAGRGGRYSWHAIEVTRAGAASTNRGPTSCSIDRAEINHQARRLPDALAMLGTWHSHPAPGPPSPDDLRVWVATHVRLERDYELTRSVHLIVVVPDYRPSRRRHATTRAWIAGRDAAGEVVIETAHVT